MNGVLNLIKPPGMTSFDAVAWTRRILNVKKAGHCGALDPDAAGVLPVCVGPATGAAGFFADSDKSYRVEAIAGLLTDTLDTSGTILDRGEAAMPERGRFEAALGAFVGDSEQTPPMYSAVKINGQKLYKLARKGVEVERSPRPVSIYALNTVYYGADRVIFDVQCSKGTYVRSLCADIGTRLGMYLCMSFLLRTSSAGLLLNDARTMEEIKACAGLGDAHSMLIPTDRMLSMYPAIDLTDSQYKLFINGAAVRQDIQSDSSQLAGGRENDVYRVYRGDRFLGLGALSADNFSGTVLRVKKFLS
ncbi:MAG: tRNA pseudouridine(55) synthase TruB [Oscillospiraceae bacterium]|nr:tRNA pseudouridine(55) synthase TruB [Oscillospiraceae bacterium]